MPANSQSSVVRCVITPNTRRYRPRRVRLTIPAGTPVIESFSLDATNRQTVHQTLVAGFGLLDGKLPGR